MATWEVLLAAGANLHHVLPPIHLQTPRKMWNDKQLDRLNASTGTRQTSKRGKKEAGHRQTSMHVGANPAVNGENTRAHLQAYTRQQVLVVGLLG